MILATKRTTGSVSIEAVIIVPLFLIVVLIILQAALWVHASAVGQAAAQDAVRTGTAADGGLAEGRAEAHRILTQRAAGSDWVVETDSQPGHLTVTITGRSLTIVPGLDIPITESASLPWET